MDQSAWQNNRKFEDPEPQGSFWSSRIMVIIVLAIVAIIGLTFFWNFLVSRTDDIDEANIPVISADPEPIKVMPQTSGGAEAPNKDKSVYELISRNPAAAASTKLTAEIEIPLQETKFETPTSEVNIKEKMVIEAVGEQKESTPVSPSSSETPTPVGKFKIQIGSLPSQAAAEQEWKRLKKKYASLLADREGSIIETRVKDKGTFYRIYLGSFATSTEAQDLCKSLSSQGAQCLVTKGA